MPVRAVEVEHSSRAFGSRNGRPRAGSRRPAVASISRSTRCRLLRSPTASPPRRRTAPWRHLRAARFFLTSGSLRADERGLFLQPDGLWARTFGTDEGWYVAEWPDIAVVQLRQGGRYSLLRAPPACARPVRSGAVPGRGRPRRSPDDVRCDPARRGTRVGCPRQPPVRAGARARSLSAHAVVSSTA